MLMLVELKKNLKIKIFTSWENCYVYYYINTMKMSASVRSNKLALYILT